jgi:hypothetical protein
LSGSRLTLSRSRPTVFDRPSDSYPAQDCSEWQKKTFIKFSIIPQQTRIAKLGKSLVASIVKGVIKTAAGVTSVGLIERLAVLQQLPAPLQISVSRPAPGRCGQILAIISGSVNFALAKYQLPKTLPFPSDALRLHDKTSCSPTRLKLPSCNLLDERQNIFQVPSHFNMAHALAN